MKKINRFLFTLMLFAGFVAIPKQQAPVKVSAVNITQGTKLYLEPNANWLQAYARFAAYFFGDGDLWISMTQTEGNPLYYEVTMNQAKSFTHVIFCRMNPGNQTNSWDNKWNQTDDLVYDGTNNLFTVAADTWDKGGGKWSTYVEQVLPPLPEFTSTVEGITNSKVRIWLDRTGKYDFGYTITMKIGEVYYSPTDYEAAIHEGRWFAYYDMPLAAFTGGPNVELVVFSNLKEEKIIPTGNYTIGDNNKIWKIKADESGVDKGEITERILPKFFAKVLEGYLTCSDSAENGFNAFPMIDTNFLPRDGEGHWNMQGNLDGNIIIDYAGVGVGGYGADRGVGEEVDAYDKYVALQNMYNANNQEGGGNITNRANTTSLSVWIVLLIGLSAAAGFYFLNEKKFNKQ